MMDTPGQFALTYAGGPGDFTITTPGTLVGDWLFGLDGIVSLSAQLTFAYGTGGATARAYLQTSLDGGATAIDIACELFTTAGETAVLNLTAEAAVVAFTPSDGALADNTSLNGILGDMVRVKVVSTGTYANTVLAARVVMR